LSGDGGDDDCGQTAIQGDSSSLQGGAKRTGPEICLLLAAERSGTHLLRSLLANVRGVAAPGEICNATVVQNRTAKSSFFRYRQQACLEDHEFFFATEPVQRKLLDGFTGHLRSAYAGRTLLVLDVKYTHVHNFNFFWWDPLDCPYLLQYAKRSRLKIVHLIRREVYRTAISGFYANETGVWRARSEQETRQIRIVVDPDKLQKKAGLVARTIGRFDDWLSRIPHLQVDYEDLLENREAVLRSLQSYLGLKHEIADQPGFVKTTPPLEDSIENFSEIEPLLDLDWKSVSRARKSQRRARAPGPK
jgi:LPS sulfotransferase NodH